MKKQTRPYVICHMMSSLDGRIKAHNWNIKNPAKYFEDQASKIKADAWLVGRVTMQEFSAQGPYKKTKGTFSIPKTDFVAPHKQKTFAVAIDPEGKCHWKKNYVSTEHVIEVLTEKVSSEYLAHLQRHKVSYIFGGKTKLDLELVLKKLLTLFNIKIVRIDGGGHVNGSFLKANLIDELSLVLVPVADGTIGSTTIFEAELGITKRRATRFTLKSIKKIQKDFLWLRYLKQN